LTAHVTIDFVREGDGLIGLKYNGVPYLYRQNLHGDVTHILDTDGKTVVRYSYDAWGNQSVNAESGYEALAEVNPYRYRGYMWDAETDLYWLNTRFYDLKVGRFISSDSTAFLDAETIGGLNLYAYCGSDPVNRVDPEGTFWRSIGNFFMGVVQGIGSTISNTARAIRNPRMTWRGIRQDFTINPMRAMGNMALNVATIALPPVLIGRAIHAGVTGGADHAGHLVGGALIGSTLNKGYNINDGNSIKPVFASVSEAILVLIFFSRIFNTL